MKGFLKSFTYAAAGIASAFKTGRNFRFMCTFAVLGIIVYAPVIKSAAVWAVILAIMGVTLCAEIFNCSIERICDHMTKNYDRDIKFIKDTSAGAVLTLCIFDAIAGSILLFSGGGFTKFINFCLNHIWYDVLLLIIIVCLILITFKKKETEK